MDSEADNPSSPPAKPVKPAKPTPADPATSGEEALKSIPTTVDPATSVDGEAVSTDSTSTVFQFSESATKSVSELLAKDSEDESLRRYKESLLGSAAHGDLGDTSDPRRLVVVEFAVLFHPEERQADVLHQLDTSAGIDLLKLNGIKMKEGAKFKFRISFRVQHEIIAGIKFINKVSTTLMSEEESLMIGSYPPSSVAHVFEFPKFDWSEAPKGMLYRGEYKVKNSFMDSDGVKHLEFGYKLQINKAWT